MSWLVWGDRMAKVTQITTCNQITTCPNWGINNAEDYPWTQADELKQQRTTPGVSPVILEQETETIIYTGSPKLDKRRLEEKRLRWQLFGWLRNNMKPRFHSINGSELVRSCWEGIFLAKGFRSLVQTCASFQYHCLLEILIFGMFSSL